MLVEPGHRGGLDRPAGLAQLLPVGHLADDAGPLGADGRGGVAEVRAQLAVAQRTRGRRRGTDSSPRRCPTPRGAVGMPRKTAVMRTPPSAARAEARCGPSCRDRGLRGLLGAHGFLRRGEDLGQVHGAGAGRAAGTARRRCASGRTRRRRCTPRRASRARSAILSVSIAVEVSAFFTANVPPKPQHWSAPGSSTSVQPADGAQQLQRPVTDPQQPQRVAGRVVGDPVRVERADVGHAEDVDQELGQLVGAARQRRRLVGERVLAGPAGDGGLLVVDRGDARPGRRHDRLGARRRRARGWPRSAPPRGGSRC